LVRVLLHQVLLLLQVIMIQMMKYKLLNQVKATRIYKLDIKMLIIGQWMKIKETHLILHIKIKNIVIFILV
jgi:hypothetical protein